MRDKLTELISSVEYGYSGSKIGKNFQRGFIERIADYLIAHGVTFADVPDTNVGKWIPVSERLPRCGERVLITEGHAVFEAYLSMSNIWVRHGIGWVEEVTHWMPLPKAPKEGE